MYPPSLSLLLASSLVALSTAAASDMTPVPLSSLDLGNAIVGWGKARPNMSSDGNPLRIGGKTYASGVGVHAQSRLRLMVSGKAQRFHAWVGVDDEIPPNKSGTVNFRVMVDGKLAWESGLMKSGEAAKECTVPLTNIQLLELNVNDGDDGIHNDHADWAEATILAPPGVVKTVPFVLTKQFARPERIRYDGHCMQIEGKDVFVYSAAFHYFRCPQPLWRDRFRKIKQAGFNTVETYVPWNWHEVNMPASMEDASQFDFNELEAWLKMAHEEFELYTIVRPGPFICAEWGGGAYPRWLAKFGPDTGGFWLRGADPEHIAWSQHWYDQVCKVFAKEQLTVKSKGAKGIIMVQIENEYNAHQAGGKETLLRALYRSVVNAGVNVPVFTCLTSECRASKDPELAQVFDCDNYYVGLRDAPSCAHRMAGLRAKQPDAPGMCTELQGGWFSLVNGSLSEENYSDERHFNAINLMTLLGGATGINEYMFVGGSHFAGWGARGMTTTYDYNAAIHESGITGPKYAVAKNLGEFLQTYEAQLTRAEGGPCELTGAPKNLFGGVRVATDGTRFVYLHNTDPAAPLSGKVTVMPGKITRPAEPMYNIDQHGNKVRIATTDATANSAPIPPFEVTYDLGALGAKVLVIAPGKSPAEGIWYPKPLVPPARPTALPAPVRISSVRTVADNFAGPWQDLPEGVSLPELKVNDARYVLYRSHVKVTSAEAADLTKLLFNTFSRDILTVEVNGNPAKRIFPADAVADTQSWPTRDAFKRIRSDEFDNTFDLNGLLQSGDNTIMVCYENLGHAHGYVPMEELSGIRQAGLSNNDKAITRPLQWQVATRLGGESSGWTDPTFDDRAWRQVALDTTCALPHKGNHLQPKDIPRTALVTWYRASFQLPVGQAGTPPPWLVRILASGNGYLYLNGHNIGRHWEAGPQREFYLPECWLKFGAGESNELVLALRQTASGAKIQAMEIAPYEQGSWQ